MLISQAFYVCQTGPNLDDVRVHYVNGPEVLKCQDKEKCKIVADRETLGYKECPEDADIQFQLTYSCDGGGNDLTIAQKPICDKNKTTPIA